MKVILGVKKGMSQLYDAKGKVIPVTVIDCSGVMYLGSKEYGADVYGIANDSLQTNVGKSKAVRGQYGLDEINAIKEVRVKTPLNLEAKSAVLPTIFEVGQKISVVSVTKGKGFQGVMRAHGMHGGPRTHGQSDKPRSIGSIAPGQTWAHVMKGRKMAKKIGNDKITIKNLRIINIDADNGLIFVKGAVAGMKKSLVIIKES